jgi:hypothetical protein
MRDSSMLKWAGLGALGLVAVGGVVLYQVRSSQAATELELLRAQVAGMQQELRGSRGSAAESAARRALEARVLAAGSLSTSPAPLPSGSQIPANREASETEPEAQLSPEEREHRATVYHQAKSTECERVFSQEGLDPEWSAPAQETLEEKYASEEFRAVRSQVECRSTLCRVEFAFDEGQEGLQASAQLQERMPWSGRSYLSTNLEQRSGVIFVSREGHTLPSVDRASLQY